MKLNRPPTPMADSRRLFVKRLFAVALAVAAAACSGKKDKAPPVQVATIQRRDIVIDAQASGIIEPINVVDVKSKASGMITKLPVETGTLVKPGDLLVQIDTRDVKNQLDQAKADLDAAQAKFDVSKSQAKRSDEMFAAKVITAQEHETAQLDLSSANAGVIRARANVDLAQQRLDDARVTASIAGTIIERDVAPGVVIASATGSIGGGTTLLKMADLSQVRIRALFNESDIGQVRGGQTATVSVDAYQDRKFTGLVEKIEPQAVVQQNVTMFPVLVTLDNRENLLKPGMNGEVSVLINDLPDAIAVPNDAVRSVREASAIAVMLNIDPDSVNAEIKAQQGNRGGGGGATKTGGAKTGTSSGDVALDPVAQQQQAGGNQQQGGGRGNRVQVSPEECATINATIDKHPKEKAKLDDLRSKMMALRGSGGDTAPFRTQMADVYKVIGVDGQKAGSCRGGRGGANNRNGNGATGGVGGPPVAPSATGTAGGRGGKSAQTGSTPQAAATQGQLQPSGEMPAQPQRRKSGLVFVATDTTNRKFAPRVIQLGQGNFDFTEVLSGLNEGDRVVMVSALMLQAQRQAANDRTKAQMGVPGLNPNATPGGAGGRGPGGGGAPGGGGGGARGGRGG
jgi:HlyD family secretion protein